MDTVSKKVIAIALEEDIGKGDVTTELTVPNSAKAIAEIVSKEPGIVCGLEELKEVFRQVDPSVKISEFLKDGDRVSQGTLVATAEGPARSLLLAERTALNFLQRLSGVATEVSKYVEAVKDYDAKIFDTRKTEPGMRAMQKRAVLCGGGTNHRMGLYDMVLIKENHIAAAGSIARAVKASRKTGLRVEVEAENLRQVEEAVKAGADVIMFDNMDAASIKRGMKIVAGRAVTEASGGINLSNVAKIASTGVDTISVGSITHSYRVLDITMRIRSVR